MNSMVIMAAGKVYIGTSGWYYKHWKDNFYPMGVRTDEQLLFYTQLFGSVELNNTFYRMPGINTIKLWTSNTPPDFIFAVKANRYLTHNKKLKECRQPLRRLMKEVNFFSEKLGPILFQLPPKWNVNTKRLLEFVKMLPSNRRFAFEFRHTSWYNEEVYSILKEYNCAFCIYHLTHHLSPLIVTTDFIYIRLHGPEGKYAGRYSIESLEKWATNINNWLEGGNDVYIYFDNDQSGYAPVNASELSEMIK